MKKYYDIKIEANVPAVFHYRVLADNEEEAAKLVSEKDFLFVKYSKEKRKNLVMKIYDYGTILLRFIKHYNK